MKPLVAIVIVNWYGTDDTLETLSSIMKSTYPSVDIIVVDNDSRDNPERMIAYYPSIHYVQTHENLGFAKGCNKGIQYVQKHIPLTSYIMFLNPDTYVDPGFLEPLVDAMEKDSTIGAAGSTLYSYKDKEVFDFVEGTLDWKWGKSESQHQGEVDTGQFPHNHETDRLSGAAFMVRMDLLRKLKGFDGQYFCYWEETDLCQRIHQMGYKNMMISASKVWHKGSVSTGGHFSPFILYYYTRNRLIFLHKYVSKKEFIRLVIYGMYDSLKTYRHLQKRKELTKRKMMAVVKAYTDYFLGKRGIRERI